MEFKDKLKNLRQSKHITQQQLAKTIFVSRSAIAKWENGLGVPSDVNLQALCEFFDVDEGWLLDRNDLKESIKGFGLQKKNIIISFFGIFLPVIFTLFSVCKLYVYGRAGEYVPLVYMPPRSVMDFAGATWAAVSVLIWSATFIFSVLNVSIISLKNKPVLCFKICLGLVILSVLIFLTVFFVSLVLADRSAFSLIFFR